MIQIASCTRYRPCQSCLNLLSLILKSVYIFYLLVDEIKQVNTVKMMVFYKSKYRLS